jgi:hypothetical protein
VPDFDNLGDLLKYHQIPFELRADQVEDVEELYPFDRVGLFNEVGTGKTATSTVLSLAWDCAHNIVLMPPILVPQWKRWLESLHDVGAVVAYRGAPVKRQAINLQAYKWILTSIQMFKSDLPHIQRQLQGRSKNLTVDEGHSVKNVGTANYKAVKEFSEGEKLQVLTGTPISSPGDAYGYVKLKTPSVYRSQAHFENLHVADRDFFGNVKEWQNLEMMQSNLMLQASRRLSGDVLKDLKQPNYIPIHYDLAPEHLGLYNQLVDEQLLLLPDGGKIDATSAGRLYNASQQIICNWSHFSGDEKCVPAVFDLIEAVADEIDLLNPAASKLIIFTYYIMTSRAVTKFMAKYDTVACYSEVSGAQQARNIARFLDDPKCRAIIAQPGSGGAGWNPQHVCKEVLWIEEPVVPWPFVQGVGRVARDGQLYVPNIRLAIAQDTIQVRLHQNLLHNDALANKVQGGFKDLRDAIHGR